MGVNPTVYELDELYYGVGDDLEKGLMMLLGTCTPPLPVVFIGGNLVGATDRVMASHHQWHSCPTSQRSCYSGDVALLLRRVCCSGWIVLNIDEVAPSSV
ncbi:hypothetical protein Ancab_003361 [Ancistrocladus abbreviatus]